MEEDTTPLKGTCGEHYQDPDEVFDEIPKLVLVEPETPKEELKKTWHISVIILSDGSTACKAFDTQEEAVKHINFVAQKCFKAEIDIIQNFVAEADDPCWIEKFENEHKKNLVIAKQKLLEVTLSGQDYGKRLRKIDYRNPYDKTKTHNFMVGPPNPKGARVVQVAQPVPKGTQKYEIVLGKDVLANKK